jgi:hypothetical protein
VLRSYLLEGRKGSVGVHREVRSLRAGVNEIVERDSETHTNDGSPEFQGDIEHQVEGVRGDQKPQE